MVDARFFNLTAPEASIDTPTFLRSAPWATGPTALRRPALPLRLRGGAYYVYQGTRRPDRHRHARRHAGDGGPPIAGPDRVPTPALVGGQPGPENSPALAGAACAVETTGPGPACRCSRPMDSDRADYDCGASRPWARGTSSTEYYVPSWRRRRASTGGDEPGVATGASGTRSYVSPAEDQTQVFVDWAPWSNADTPTSIVLNAGQWATLVDPYDGDNTGARIYSQRLSGGARPRPARRAACPRGGFSRCAWGRGASSPTRPTGTDLGYGAPPQKRGSSPSRS